MRSESKRAAGGARTRSALVLSIASVVAVASTGCRGPLRNPEVATRPAVRVVAVAEQPAEHAPDPEHADVATSIPFAFEDDAIVPFELVALDMTHESTWSSPSTEYHSPLWIPTARPADYRWASPPGRVEHEGYAAALILCAALIASSALAK